MGVSNTDFKMAVEPQVLSRNEFRHPQTLPSPAFLKIFLDSNNDIRTINKVIKGGW